jgi:hypothetical protein
VFLSSLGAYISKITLYPYATISVCKNL